MKSTPVIDGDTIYLNTYEQGGEGDPPEDIPPYDKVLAEFDRNKDGRLSATEAPSAYVKRRWETLDLDKDGYLNKREWQFYRARRAAQNMLLAIRVGGSGDLTSPDPSRYVELLRQSYAAVKAANPNARVAIDGMSPGSGNGQVNAMSAASFLESVYQNGGKSHFDAVAFHPYNDGVSPDLYLEDYINSVHDVMTEYGDGSKSVWVTEIGWFVGAQVNGLSWGGCLPLCCPAPLALWKLFRDQAERGSGIGLKLFGFIAESVFTIIPESCSGSPRNSVRNHPGTAFTFARIPHAGVRIKAERSEPKGGLMRTQASSIRL